MVSSLFAGIPSLLVVIEEGWLPESLTRRTRPWGTYAPPMGGRHQIGMVAGFNSEWWPASNRNPGRHHVGIPGRNASESAPSRDVGLLNERLLGSTVADGSLKISRKQSPAPRRGSSSPAFACSLGVWQGPENMGINIESDSQVHSFGFDHFRC